MDLIPKLLEELNLLVETNKNVAELERIVADQQLKISELSATVHEQNFRIELLETEIEELKHDQVNSQESSSNPNQRQMVQCEPDCSQPCPEQNQEDRNPTGQTGQQTASLDFLPTTPGRTGDEQQSLESISDRIAARHRAAERSEQQFQEAAARSEQQFEETTISIGRRLDEFIEAVSEPTTTIDVEARTETSSADLPGSNNIGLLPETADSGSMVSGAVEQRGRERNNSRQPQSPTIGASRKRKSKKRRKKGFGK